MPAITTQELHADGTPCTHAMAVTRPHEAAQAGCTGWATYLTTCLSTDCRWQETGQSPAPVANGWAHLATHRPPTA